MALGIQTESGGGGNFTPNVKINAKQGRVWREDRVQTSDGWQKNEVDITSNFQFVPDMAGIEVGWLFFKTGQAPDIRTVKLGQALPERPGGVDDKGAPLFKQGVRLLVKLGKDCGGDVREISATAKSVLGPIDKLHDAWAAGVAANPGKSPLVKLTEMKKIDTKSQHGTNTNFEPQFEIVRWIDTPSFVSAASAPEEPKQAPAPPPADDGGDEEF